MSDAEPKKPEVAGVAKKRPRRKDFYDKLKAWGGFIAAVAIPTVLALVGNRVSLSLKQQETHLETLKLAIGVLRDPPTDSTRELRKWATTAVFGADKSNEAVRTEVERVPVPTERSWDYARKALILSGGQDATEARLASALAGHATLVVFGSDQEAATAVHQAEVFATNEVRRVLWILHPDTLADVLRKKYLRPDALVVAVGLDGKVHDVIKRGSLDYFQIEKAFSSAEATEQK